MTRPAPTFDPRLEMGEHERPDESWTMDETTGGYWARQAPPAPYTAESGMRAEPIDPWESPAPGQTTVVGGPHDGKVITLAPHRMIVRTSSGTYMRHARLPEYLFHVPRG